MIIIGFGTPPPDTSVELKMLGESFEQALALLKEYDSTENAEIGFALATMTFRELSTSPIADTHTVSSFLHNVAENPVHYGVELTVGTKEHEGFKIGLTLMDMFLSVLSERIRTNSLGKTGTKLSDFYPMLLDRIVCRHCKNAEVELVRTADDIHYTPCPSCGYIRKMPPRAKPKAMRCPECKTPLVKSVPRFYQDLSQHVSDPNGLFPLPLRHTFVCPKKDCKLTKEIWFSDDGDVYGDVFSKFVSHKYAIGSLSEYVHNKIEKSKQKEKKRGTEKKE